MTFFPPPEFFFSGIDVQPDDLVANKQVTIDGAVLRELIAMALFSVKIDEDDYRRYSDIDEALNKGEIESATQHYVQSGYFEGRFLPAKNFDGDWYLNTYPDVRVAIENRDVVTAKEHYLEMGWREWRAPSYEAVDHVKKWRRLLK